MPIKSMRIHYKDKEPTLCLIFLKRKAHIYVSCISEGKRLSEDHPTRLLSNLMLWHIMEKSKIISANAPMMENKSDSEVAGVTGYATLPYGSTKSANIYGGSGVGINKFISDDVEPTAASALSPANRPTTIISAALNSNCKIPEHISGSAKINIFPNNGPLHMSISYFFSFDMNYHTSFRLQIFFC